MITVNHWLGGRHHDEAPKRTGPVFDPSMGQQIGEVALAEPEDVDLAVSIARKVFLEWRDKSLTRRAQILFRFRDLIDKHADDLARLVTAENGKVLSDARGEVRRGIEVIEYACSVPDLLKGECSENVSTDVDSYSSRQPLGVVAGITPFNFPVMVPMWMYPIAIACGNTFVLKPSEKVPSVVNLAAELFSDAGLPDGVLNIVHGDKVAVDRILAHPDVAAVSFVGSTSVARYVYAEGAAVGKRIQALGGAKNHMVVLPDADMDLAATSAVNSAFGSAGERCMAISVLVTVGDVAERLMPKLQERIAAVRVGAGDREGADMGPVVTADHRKRIRSYIDQGVAQGATLVTDGRTIAHDGGGFFLAPTLFDNVTPDMAIYADEIFGPVLSVVRVQAFRDAIALVNANPYANGVALFTRDGAAARMFARNVDVGMVGINVPVPVPTASYSFGGWKGSLYGDSHMHGREGVRFYTRGKVVTSRWPATSESCVDLDLVFPHSG